MRCLDLKNAPNAATATKCSRLIDLCWGDVRQVDLDASVRDIDAIVHLAGVLPPKSDEAPGLAHDVNVCGTQRLIAAALRLRHPPTFLFASSCSVFGHTQDLPPPRRVSDPTNATDFYTRQKLECEEMVQKTDLPWLIFRFAHVPFVGLRKPHPVLFEIPLTTRIEVLHPLDAGFAIANALDCKSSREKILLIGGGPRCQIHFREYLDGLLGASGLGQLPQEAFGTQQYYTDWLDTTESQRLLKYQRYSFADIVYEVTRAVGLRRYFLAALRPLLRRRLMRMSPYWNYGSKTARPRCG